MHLFHLGTKPHSLYSRAQGFIDSKITFSSIHRRYMAIMLKVLQGTLPMFLKFSAKKKKRIIIIPDCVYKNNGKLQHFLPGYQIFPKSLAVVLHRNWPALHTCSFSLFSWELLHLGIGSNFGTMMWWFLLWFFFLWLFLFPSSFCIKLTFWCLTLHGIYSPAFNQFLPLLQV